MIVHVVMFKFKDENKASNIQKVQVELDALVAKIPALKSMEVGVNFSKENRAFDLFLHTTFDTKEDLKTYAVHEKHLKVIELIKKVTIESKVVDYIKN